MKFVCWKKTTQAPQAYPTSFRNLRHYTLKMNEELKCEHEIPIPILIKHQNSHTTSCS